ncbi:putative YHM2-protein of the mitochondrial carrier family [Jaminaea rosea]|uniref:Putative YHM2-protein of the mitochondrial carrier family n=1 Tax=Jaminaea rosea TaxID=1569628 RepID=A0A316UJ75_9BASI|nr:putative YHM2-protein of the mitochondrial carrier family [Jaminaea rosea]PWN25342.1 putative YHM2-protein of the mitochondrial carrier family [Jaminaea rosea]
MAPQQGGFSWSNIAVGSLMNLFEVTTLGQPLEVTKTTMAANRSLTMAQALKEVWSRGGVLGYYQGLIPWAWIEASTKGAVLLFTAAEIEKTAVKSGIGAGSAGLLGGMGGGIAQAYATMGFCTCMKTAEITRHKQSAAGIKPPGTFQVFMDIYRKEGIAGINKGVNAVALRQCTNWGSRMGFARLAEAPVRSFSGKGEKEKLSPLEKIFCSSIGGALGCWNQPIEVVRVEMQSMAKAEKTVEGRPNKPGVFGTLGYIYRENGIKGLYRGISPRIALGIWQTVCMVALADHVRGWVSNVNEKGVKAAVEEAAEDAKAKADKLKEVTKTN